MRNPEYAVYGAAESSKTEDLDEGEAAFNELSMQERSKFKEETLVNVGGRERKSRYSRCAHSPQHKSTRGTRGFVFGVVASHGTGGRKLGSMEDFSHGCARHQGQTSKTCAWLCIGAGHVGHAKKVHSLCSCVYVADSVADSPAIHLVYFAWQLGPAFVIREGA
jgi:hypothetical protein